MKVLVFTSLDFFLSSLRMKCLFLKNKNCRLKTKLLFACLVSVITYSNAAVLPGTGKAQYDRAIKAQRVNTNLALMHIDSALVLANKGTNTTWKGTVLLAKAKIHLYRGEVDLAIEHALLSRKTYLKAKNKSGLIDANLLLSQAYSITKERSKSEKCLSIIEKYANISKDKSLAVEVINCKGNNCFQAGENEKAMQYYREAERRVKAVDDPYLATKIQNNIANILVNTGKPQEALPLYRKALVQYRKLNFPLDELLVLYNIGRQFRAANMPDSSLYYGNKCLELGFRVHSLEDVTYAYSALRETYKMLGDYERALEYSELMHIYKDSLQMNANKALITRLETDYALKINKEIIDRQQRKLQRNKQKITIVVLALFGTSMLIVLGSFYYRKSRKLNKALKQSNSEILEQNQTIDRALNEKEVLLKEVHHRVKNSLQIVSSLLNLQEAQLTDVTAIEALRNSKTRIQTIGLMHQSLYQKDADLGKVNSSEYLKNILELQLEALTSKTGSPRTHVQFVEQELSIDQAVPLGLIASEVINNALKHAYSDTEKPLLTLISNVTNGKFELQIADNGKGFESSDFRNHSSLGLEIVEALTDQLHGTMECVSTGEGTTFRFLFPIE